MRLFLLILAVAVLALHFAFTDNLRHTRPLELKALGAGQAFMATQPELQQQATNALAITSRAIEGHVEKANRRRGQAGAAKWICIGITSLMMLIAGLTGRAVPSNSGQGPDQILNLLREEGAKRSKLAVIVGLLSAAVAAATMIGSQLEVEQAAERERAKDMHVLYNAARSKLLDPSSTPIQVQEAIRMLEEARLK